MLTLKQHSSSDYGPRTRHNASSAQLTIAFAADLTTAGEMLTKKAASGAYLGFLIKKEDIENPDYIDAVSKEISSNFNDRGGSTLNVAGNGIYTLNEWSITQSDINFFIYQVLQNVIKNTKIQCVLSGGQTGVDIAAAVAAQALGFPAIITFPKGFLQRDVNKIDKRYKEEQIRSMVESMSAETLKKSKTVNIENAAAAKGLESKAINDLNYSKENLSVEDLTPDLAGTSSPRKSYSFAWLKK